MSNVIEFPIKQKQDKSDLETVINKALQNIPAKDRERIKFDLIKTIDSYDSYFTEWVISLPAKTDETFKQQFLSLARQEHERKMRMLADIIKLKIESLVNDYRKGN